MAKKKPIQTPETIAPVEFPVKGIDVSQPYEQQPPMTTPEAVNVRAWEPTLNRARGGSRPGLSEYIPQQVNGFNKIQDLNLVTWTNILASGDDTGTADPSNAADRNLRGGKKGFQPVRHPGPIPPPTSIISLVQKNTIDRQLVFMPPPPYQNSFSANVTAGNLILVFFLWGGLIRDEFFNPVPGEPALLGSCTDTLGNSFTLLSAQYSQSIPFPTNVPGEIDYVQLAVWYAISAHSGADTISVNLSKDNGEVLTIMEFRNVNPLNPIDATSIAASTYGNPSGAQQLLLGSIHVSGTGEMILAGIGALGAIRTPLPGGWIWPTWASSVPLYAPFSPLDPVPSPPAGWLSLRMAIGKAVPPSSVNPRAILKVTTTTNAFGPVGMETFEDATLPWVGIGFSLFPKP